MWNYFQVIIYRGKAQEIPVRQHKETPLVLKRISRQYELEEKYENVRVDVRCMSPLVGMSMISSCKPLSILLTSGTLSPLANIGLEFGLQVDLVESYPHVCADENISVRYITTSEGRSVVGNFQNRNTSGYARAVIDTIQAAYHKLQKGGILVFFQSYSVLCQFTQALKARLQNVYFE